MTLNKLKGQDDSLKDTTSTNNKEHLRYVRPFGDLRGRNVELCSQNDLGQLPRTDQMK